MIHILHQCSSKILTKIISFLKHPHIPWFLEKSLKTNFPRIHRLLRYRTLDPTSKRYWNGVWREEGLSTWRTYPNLFEKISEKVRPSSSILDIGCGPGVLLNKLQVELKCECFGLDISTVAIELLKGMNISGVVARLPEIPFKDSSFDTVIATEVLEHLENPSETLNQMKRVAKPGGLLICSVPNESMTKEECDEHLHDFTSESLTNLVKELGNFKISNVDDHGGPRLFALIKITSK